MNETPKFGCEHCYGEDPIVAWAHKHANRITLIDESHFAMTLSRCTDCGQQFIRIFVEFVDWTDGEDPQYCDLVPVTAQEADMLAAQGSDVDFQTVENLAQGRRRVQVNWPKGQPQQVRWMTGGLIIARGD